LVDGEQYVEGWMWKVVENKQRVTSSAALEAASFLLSCSSPATGLV